MNSNNGQRRSRGRPRGTGYSMDAPILDKIADAIVRDPKANITAVILEAGLSAEADIRRLQRKFKAQRDTLLAAAHKRAYPPRPQKSEVSQRREPYGPTYGHFSDSILDAARKHEKLMEQISKPAPWQAYIDKMTAQANLIRNIEEKAAGSMNSWNRMLEQVERAQTFSVTDPVRRALEAQLKAWRDPFKQR